MCYYSYCFIVHKKVACKNVLFSGCTQHHRTSLPASWINVWHYKIHGDSQREHARWITNGKLLLTVCMVITWYKLFAVWARDQLVYWNGWPSAGGYRPKPPQFVTSCLGQLSLLPSVGQKMSTSQCGDVLQLGIKGSYMVHSTSNCGVDFCARSIAIICMIFNVIKLVTLPIPQH